nr:MAG TPA: hypothetical protein [Caudoviricetes sp.]
MYDCSDFNITNGEIVGQGDFNKSKTLIFVKCFICEETCKYKATVLKHKLKTKSWCSNCNLKRSYGESKLISELDAITRINSVNPLYSFDKWDTAYSTFTKSKAYIKCSTCSTSWITNLNNFTTKNKGCPNCCHKGFNAKKPAIVYVNKIEYPGGTALKYGITSNHDFRLWQQNHFSKCISSKLYYREFELGAQAKMLESAISVLYIKDRGYLNKDIMVDGYTETLPYYLKNDLINFIEGWKG